MFSQCFGAIIKFSTEISVYCMDGHIFVMFALKGRLWVLVRTALRGGGGGDTKSVLKQISLDCFH